MASPSDDWQAEADTVSEAFGKLKIHYKLSLVSCQKLPHSWVIKGVMSRPMCKAPIPIAVAHATFRADETDPSNILYRLEEERTWRPVSAMSERFIDRVIDSKLQVREIHHDIATDQFGATRSQLPFKVNQEEEAKISKDKEQAIYSDESDDEYFTDKEIFGDNIPVYEESQQDKVRQLDIEIAEAVHDAFQDIEEDYFAFIDALLVVEQQLSLSKDDVIVLYSLLKEDELNKPELEAQVISTLQRRLTHESYQDIEEQWPEEFLELHSFGLDSIITGIVQRVMNHVDAGETESNLPRNELREALYNDGDGLMEAEVHAFMALQGDPCIQREDRLTEHVRAVRLAFARDHYLVFGTLRDLQVYIASLIGTPQLEPPAPSKDDGAFSSSTKVAKDMEDVTISRPSLFRKLISDPYGPILTKQSAMALLASCNGDTEQDDHISCKNFIEDCAQALTELLWPARIIRNLQLVQRQSYKDEARRHFLGKSRTVFNKDIWIALESGFTERSLGGMAASTFFDIVQSQLLDTVSSTLVQCLAAANAYGETDVICKPLARYAFDYVRQLAHALALAEERFAEDEQNALLEKFRSRETPLQVLSISKVAEKEAKESKESKESQDHDRFAKITVLDPVRDTEYTSTFEAEKLCAALQLAEPSELFPATPEEVDEVLAKSLLAFLFIDLQARLALHIPLR